MRKKIRDIILFPLRCLFPNNENISFLGATPLSQERFDVIKMYLKGKVLDVGCGDNRLIREYRKLGNEGIGIDLIPNKDADLQLEHTKTLPFTENTFDVITFIASLNHICERQEVLKEARRCLKKDGILLIVVLNRTIGWIGHKLWHLFGSDADLRHRKMQKGERCGLSKSEVFFLLKEAGFNNIRKKCFSLGLNNLYIADK